jgi:phosphoesterase RecJ-like protein
MYLYGGLLTDTNRFLYPTTKPSTFELASKLFTIDFNKNKLYDIIYLKTLKEAKFDSYIMSLVKFDSNSSFAYAVIPKNAFKKFDIGLRMSMVHVLNNIKNIQI